jgi:predicted nuclease of predicted toxin-antitoxin system
MRILIDQNISFRIISRISNILPDCVHVKTVNLIDANDFQIFMYARKAGFDVVITQDEDFNLLQIEHGIPPKIIWLRTGNCSTALLANVILDNKETIHNFLADPGLDCLELYG